VIPIRDINPRARLPVVNYALLVFIGVVFLFQVSLGSSVDALVRAWGFVPGDFRAAIDGGQSEEIGRSLLTLVSSLFLHGGWFHVIGNLLYLRVFGDNIEDRFGHVGFFLFYVASGAAGAMAQVMFEGRQDVPVIGASGAIAGVLGAYVVLYPAARVVTLFPIFIILTFIEVPAFVFLGIWALQQLLNGYLALGDVGRGEGVAWFAHIGGFALGLLAGAIARVLGMRKKEPTILSREA
jgi:membrane associated rhomboid family serine protease